MCPSFSSKQVDKLPKYVFSSATPGRQEVDYSIIILFTTGKLRNKKEKNYSTATK